MPQSQHHNIYQFLSLLTLRHIQQVTDIHACIAIEMHHCKSIRTHNSPSRYMRQSEVSIQLLKTYRPVFIIILVVASLCWGGKEAMEWFIQRWKSTWNRRVSSNIYYNEWFEGDIGSSASQQLQLKLEWHSSYYWWAAGALSSGKCRRLFMNCTNNVSNAHEDARLPIRSCKVVSPSATSMFWYFPQSWKTSDLPTYKALNMAFKTLIILSYR